VKALLASALRLLEGHRRPGNIRELRTAIERPMVLIHH
jgi:transcriptional regulator with PAS, ATPase and Fis domain